MISGDDLHLFAGAGIVPGSVADSEWKELDRKTSTLCSLFEQPCFDDGTVMDNMGYKSA
jgi:menaquinone-specific isochorismate synthase